MTEIAFTKEYQTKILALMLQDNEFRLAIRDHVTPESFNSSVFQWFYTKLADDRVHSKVTLKEELISAAKSKIIKESDVNAFIDTFTQIKEHVNLIDSTHIKETVSQFIRTQAVKSAVLDAIDLMKTNDHWDEIASRMVEACGMGLSVTDGGHKYLSQTEDRLARRTLLAPTASLPVGIPELDTVLNGGLELKQLGLVAGGTGKGKSLMLQWIAKTALLLGRKVVYFTLELSEDDMAKRFDSMIANVEFSNVKYYNDDISKTMQELHAKYGDNLIIKEYPEDTASVNTFKSFLLRLSSTGFVPDLVIVDYLACMKPHRTYNAQHEEEASIARALRGMAKEFNTRVWTASQLNRGGMVMEDPDETAVQGSVGKLFTCDVALFMAQTKEEKYNNIMRIIIMKNRNGMAQRSVSVLQDYAYMTFYKEAYAATPTFEPSEEPKEEVSNFQDDDDQACIDDGYVQVL